ncbi:MAG: lysine 2,3-aminomutase [Melioribacteraceae bacterium]|nr:lysine 2,3-aminomutase [Melioribacteraceae bacterium]MCF8354756.1 lysine 2,3-aminomutase [Melioribacteraceae bacterium]MCF8394381.1 lysine 2,3-aminomutase [Melioribacteraceae bacterium]MCF8417523.1 lysine 2,3-aminomutase [Melioribacteraceae bacterium]
MKLYGVRHLDKLPELNKLSEEDRFATKVVATVLPFRTNNYVVEELIDWDNVPNDPMFQLTFTQKGMLKKEHFNKMADAIRRDASSTEIKSIANEIRYELNPHPAGQMTANIPFDDDEMIPGVQHKYRETALIFPSAGQTCHAYCTFCFRWAQFVGLNDLKFATDESNRFQGYLKKHREITDVLFTGGDPMVMTLDKLKVYIEPLLQPEFDHIRNIRIGTKSIAYWPYKYVTDKDADGVLQLFEKVIKAGKHLAIMSHYNHWVELSTDVSKEAVRRIRNTGAEIRTQSPLIKHINNDSAIWEKMWKEQVKQGMIPYYMFIERNTGAKEYFEVPLGEAFQIFRDAYKKLSGLHRTVRGPSMSATPGKVAIEGVTTINGEKVYMLNFIQGRNADWVKRPFFAKYDKNATWLTDLKPAFGKDKFFYTDELETILEERRLKVEKIMNLAG